MTVEFPEAAIEKVPIKVASETVENGFHVGQHALDFLHVAAREPVRETGRRGDLMDVVVR